MCAVRSFSLVPCVVLLFAGMAWGQQAQFPAPAPQLKRGYMTAAAGASFSDQKATTFAIEIGEALNRHVQAYAAFTYFDDLFNDSARNDLARLEAALTGLTGSSWQFQGRDRGLALSGGAKYLLSDGPSVRPYVGGGPGVLNLRRVITERDLGDISDPVLAVFGAADGVIDASRVSTFKPMAEVVAGVGIAAGRTVVDVGYRFRTVFRTREAFTFSQFSVGVGMTF